MRGEDLDEMTKFVPTIHVHAHSLQSVTQFSIISRHTCTIGHDEKEIQTQCSFLSGTRQGISTIVVKELAP